MPKFTFRSNFHVTFTPNHWSNLEKCEDLFKVIIFPYLSAKKKELGYPEDQRSLIIMDTFKGQDNEEMKRLFPESNCKLAIVPHNLANKFQSLGISINQSAKKFISNKFNTWYADRVSKQLSNGVAPAEVKVSLKLSDLKPLYARWIVETYNRWIVDPYTIILNTKMIPLSKVSILQGSARLSYVQTMSSHE